MWKIIYKEYIYTCTYIHSQMYTYTKTKNFRVHQDIPPPCVTVDLAFKRSIAIFWRHPAILFKLCCVFIIWDYGFTATDINWRLREMIYWLVDDFAISYDFERPPLSLISLCVTLPCSLHLGRCCCLLSIIL